MSSADYFFVIFVSTISIVRVFLYLKPIPSSTIKGFRLHHYMFGLALLPIAYVIQNITLAAVGWGLFLDELTYLLIGGKTHEDNYSKKSLIGTIVIVVIVFFLKGVFV